MEQAHLTLVANPNSPSGTLLPAADLEQLAAKIGGMLVVEAFGQGLPGLAAATKIWRRMFEDEERLAADALAFMKKSWDGP